MDAVRCAVTGERAMRSLAITASGLYQPYSFRMSLIGLSKRLLSLQARHTTWVWSDGHHVHGLASVRPRSGTQSWELSHLYTDSLSATPVARLLESVSAAAARSGGQRVFLRLDADSPLVSIARLAGFFPSHSETLYRGTTEGHESGHGLFDANARLRRRRPEDDFGLFRLYNAITPVKVRQLVGMTFDQWSASHERNPGRPYERVFDVDDEVKGWLSTAARFGTGSIAVKLRPDYRALTPDVVAAGLRSLSGSRTVLAMVEEYCSDLGSALVTHGFQPQGTFMVLVKSMAQRVRAEAPARSSRVAVD